MGKMCNKSLVVNWMECRITEQEIRGSGPGSNPGKVYIFVCIGVVGRV